MEENHYFWCYDEEFKRKVICIKCLIPAKMKYEYISLIDNKVLFEEKA